MKKHTNLISRNWRNFGSIDKPKEDNITINAPIVDDAENTTVEPGKLTSKDAQQYNIDKFVKPSMDNITANNLGGVKPLGLGKLRDQVNKLNKKFDKNIRNSKIKQNPLYSTSDYSANEEYKVMKKVMTEKQQERLEDFELNLDYSRINKNPATSGNLTLNEVKNRRLAVELSRVISKLAEDHVGATTDGDDFWDCDRLVMRQFNKESIYSCRNSREKQNIVIMLDSSPSCEKQAKFYSDIASQVCQFGDVELYDAPNARLVHKYSPRDKRFVDFLTMDDVANNIHRLSAFKNRVIIFFGDMDGFHVMANASFDNKIYYFHTDGEGYIQDCLDSYQHKSRNFKIMPKVTNVKKFMEACKKLK